jgi:hypothetical protein
MELSGGGNGLAASQALDLLDLAPSSFQGGPEFMGRHERGELWCVR